ncbi:amino acid ABC transporter substrate-binding protein [Crocosphaera sp. XPORK-15E]|uniref:amino acid ABC transporter substrate-binding protein n=1 Tax=Crocosphaera sp. XPORK-15E TaxID=3110247 RepID=UPI002B214BCA|nr:amino acid ABC transporter substrate-binding protein [Crocosphaera sp. XPORK-15E]MEA5537379.1 amino acid ABC transporter substrate-binding protein [Crocosphaera sp. XPORK-15E]
MGKKLVLLVLTLLLTTTYQLPSWAGRILEKIQQTGVITAGTRKDAIPFGYVNEKGQWVGYSIDILEIIRQDVEKKLGKPIKLKLVEVTPQNRFDKIKNREIDIECASSTFTWERDKSVDFTVSYFASGTKILVKKGSDLGTIESLAGRKIGVILNTTNEQAIKRQQPAAKIIPIKDQNDGLDKLNKGEIEAMAGDGIVLQGLRLENKNPNSLEVVPEFPYVYEAYACMIPEDESAWRGIVNYSLVKFMEGIVSDQPEQVAIYEKWFGEEKGVTPYSREAINDYFQGIVDSYEWIPLIGN